LFFPGGMVGDDLLLEKAANLVAKKFMFFLKMVRASMAVQWWELKRMKGEGNKKPDPRSIKRLLVMLKFTP